MVGVAPAGGALYGAVIPSPLAKRLCSSRVPNSWVLVWNHSSPESGFGASMSVPTWRGTQPLPSGGWCSAHAGTGLDSPLPTTPSKSLPSSGP